MARSGAGGNRYLTTVMFTDIVESTQLAGQLGDRAWRDLVEQHNELIRRQLRRFGGREVDTAGDGFFAAFDAPARAVACALTVIDQVEELGLRLRAGIHTGEVEEAGGKLRGIAVHIGSRVGAQATAGEVLVSATVRDLVAGTAVAFDDRGSHELKGVTGEWHLYAATRGSRFAEEFGTTGQSAGREVAAVRRSVALRARRRRLVVAGVSVAVLATLAVGIYLVMQPPPSLPAVAANTAGLIDAATGRILAEVPVGGRPDGIAFGEGAIWVADESDATVTRIDPVQRTRVQTINVETGPGGIAVGFGAVWVANGEDRSVSRIDAATNRVVKRISVGGGPSAVATGSGYVWVTNAIDGTAARIDPADDSVTTYDVGGAPAGVAADDTSVWITTFDQGTLKRLKPATGEVLGTIPVGSGPRAVAVVGGTVWVANELDGTVMRIDPAAARVADTFEVGRGPSGLAGTSKGEVWVASAVDGAVYRISPATKSATRFATGSAPRALAVAGEQVWVSARASASSHRGGTLRLVGSEPIDTIDPAVAFLSSAAISFLSMTNDGLVAFQRTGGFAGATIVPDLAVSIPQPTEGGTAYAFQLRSDLTYSDGQPVRASDFRHSIERTFEVPETADVATALAYFGRILGAADCEAHIGEACDLSAGIVVDDAAGTISFHLEEADPDFLQKLALTFAVAVPASVTGNDVGLSPVPATGAYMIDSFSPTAVRLVRNPRFREWSQLARPEGYPDEIVWTVGAGPDELVEMVVDGSAEALTIELPPPNHARLDQLLTQYPGRTHSSILGTSFLYMNTLQKPFDDPRVRQAVSFAIDRGELADSLGGGVAARVTCQVLAPTLPGYSPYCPYTINPNPGGTWSGPDIAAARELMTAAQPSKVDFEILTFPRFAPAAESIAASLREIGLNATVRVGNSPSEVAQELADPVEGPKVSAAIHVWIPDIRSTLDQVYPILQCGNELNFTRYCDAAIDEAVLHAIDVQQHDPSGARQAWAAADQTIVNLAPAAPLVNVVYTDFVGAQVGNYQFHPQWGPLYDQLWVK